MRDKNKSKKNVLASVLCFRFRIFRDNWSGCFVTFPFITAHDSLRSIGRLLIIVNRVLMSNYSRSHYRNSIIGLMSVNIKLLIIAQAAFHLPRGYDRHITTLHTTAKRAFIHHAGKCNNFPQRNCPVTVKDKFKLENSYR